MEVRSESAGVGAQVVHHLVPGRVPVPVAGETHPGQRGVSGRGEQGEAVVVARPRPARRLIGLQNQGAGEAVTRGESGGGQAGLPGADDEEVGVFHEIVGPS